MNSSYSFSTIFSGSSVRVWVMYCPHEVGSLLLAKTRLHSCTVFASLYTCNMQVNLTHDCGIDGMCETDFGLSVVGATYLPDRSVA